jgi:RNA polymerase sigma-70 factor, ECF subfamily
VSAQLSIHASSRARGSTTSDSDGFAELYQAHAGQVYATCLRMAGDPVRARELTQDVFVQAWRKRGSYRGDGEMGGWLKRIAVNLALNTFRSEKRRRARVETTDNLVPFDRGTNPVATEMRMALEEAIAGLPERARAVFVLYDVEGYRQEEIAERMGTTVGTVKAQLHRARKLLREALK